MVTTSRRLRINGRVQGVGFRWAMVDEATRLGVRGWVRNRRDGTVEAQVEGTAEAVAALTRWAGQGPAGARVDHVDAVDGPTENAVAFESRATV
ncbi:MAG: acylphosphatase [Burkholderiaceae bacterium]